MSQQIKITLQFDVNVDGPASDLRWEIDHILGQWSDGRYPFNVELIREGLEGVVCRAVRLAVEQAARKEFGDEMVQVSPRSQSSRSCVEADKVLKDLSVHLVGDGRALAAHVVDDGLEYDSVTRWRVLCRDDRQPDGSLGPYAMSSRVFDDAQMARTWAMGMSSSRFPLVVEAEKAETVMGALNMKGDRWKR